MKTREILEASAGTPLGRTQLQELGRELDQRTAGRWVAQAVENLASPLPQWIVVDAVRIAEQVDGLRELAPTLHIHLTAPTAVLAERHALAHPADPDYSIVSSDSVERAVEALARIADLVIDTGENDVTRTRDAAATFNARPQGP